MNNQTNVTRTPQPPISVLREIKFGNQFALRLVDVQQKQMLGCNHDLINGIKLLVIQQGEIVCHLTEEELHCNNHHLLWLFCGDKNSQNLPLLQATTVPLRYAILHLGGMLLQEGLRHIPASLLFTPAGQPQAISCPVHRSIPPLLRQMFACPWQDRYSDVYLSGKALEMVALSWHHGQQQESAVISMSDAERLQQVRAILASEYQQPPGLDELASRVGINTRKLTRGFRRMYGKSVHSWLQEFRLQLAYSLLCSTEANVSSVAFQVGYTPSHFCSVFRHRFGISPGKLSPHCI